MNRLTQLFGNQKSNRRWARPGARTLAGNLRRGVAEETQMTPLQRVEATLRQMLISAAKVHPMYPEKRFEFRDTFKEFVKMIIDKSGVEVVDGRRLFTQTIKSYDEALGF